MKEPALRRDLTLVQATALNMIDMVGIGPFVTLSLIVGAMGGPQCILAWILGAALAFMDGAIWSELGAKWPLAGGSYAFLQKLWPPKLGRWLAFLFIWQTTVQAPLVIASGAIGFSKYFSYLMPLEVWQAKALSGGLVLLIVLLLYRNIKSVGSISVVLWCITGGTLLWIILSAIPSFSPGLAFGYGPEAFDLNAGFFAGLSKASLKTIYCYLGYYNVCHLGAEIRNPERVIPKSIFISIGGIAILYLCMQLAVLGVLPWQEIAESDFVISLYFEKLYGPGVAQLITGLILLIALSSLFAVMLGYSRVLYAAAAEGNFFNAFARLHPKGNFPHVSLLVLGGIAFVFSLLFRMGEVISALITMRILIQFISQTLGLVYWHYARPDDVRPWKMYLFPLLPLGSLALWFFIFLNSDWYYIAGAFGMIALGSVLYRFVILPRPVST